MLEAQGKSDLLNQLRSVLPSYASCIYIRQPAPLGLGHAVLCAQPAVGAEPFFVHLADDLIRSDVACLQQMAEVYEAKRASVLGVQVVPHQDTEKYGIVAVEADKSATSRVRSIVEKPKPAVAPSNLAVVGRYVLAPSIFEHLERIGRGAGGEIQLTDGIAALMGEEAVYAHRFTRQALRLRQQARLPAGDRRVRAGASAAGQGIPQVPATLNLTGIEAAAGKAAQAAESEPRPRAKRAPQGSGSDHALSGQRQPHGHQRAATGAVGDAQPPAVRLDDLAAQCEPESGAGRLGRIERQQRVAQHVVA